MTLAITGLLSGLVLVCIYLVTQPLILRNQAEALRRAIYRVLPGTEEISTFVLQEGSLVPFEAVGDEEQSQALRGKVQPTLVVQADLRAHRAAGRLGSAVDRDAQVCQPAADLGGLAVEQGVVGTF